MGTFATALNIPMIVGLLLVPTIVAKLGGMYKINYTGYAIATVADERNGYLAGVDVLVDGGSVNGKNFIKK